MSKEDDENAQQLKIRKFIVHTSYTKDLDYNDIAMIETVERIIFNNFVVPSCIVELYDFNGTESTVSGYGDDVSLRNAESMNLLMLSLCYIRLMGAQ